MQQGGGGMGTSKHRKSGQTGPSRWQKCQWTKVDMPYEVAARSPHRLIKYYKSMVEDMKRGKK